MGARLSVACVLIVSEKRIGLVQEKVLPSVLDKGFDEIVWVGDGEPGEGYRFLNVPKLTGTTTDALVKRDVGTVATSSEWLFYMCDDHALVQADWPTDGNVFVPKRVSRHPTRGVIPINMGLDPNDPNRPYCGGHAGLFHRSLIQRRPWTAMPHHRLWDLISSRIQMQMGAEFVEAPGIVIQDLEPEASPWQ